MRKLKEKQSLPNTIEISRLRDSREKPMLPNTKLSKELDTQK